MIHRLISDLAEAKSVGRTHPRPRAIPTEYRMATRLTVAGMAKLLERPTTGFTRNGNPFQRARCSFRVGWDKEQRRPILGFVDVTHWGEHPELTAAEKGTRLLVCGRLDWSEWQAKDGSKRSKVAIVAEEVHVLGVEAKTS